MFQSVSSGRAKTRKLKVADGGYYIGADPQNPQIGDVRIILNNSFGMLGINSALIVKRFED